MKQQETNTAWPKDGAKSEVRAERQGRSNLLLCGQAVCRESDCNGTILPLD